MGSLDGADEDIQADKDQVDVRNRDGDLTGNYEPTIEHVIECFEQGEIGLQLLDVLAIQNLVEGLALDLFVFLE